MKLLKKLRKGFTLIELVVVIAVIAILSAVSVVSYVAITNRAHQSNDQQLVDQVNTSLYSYGIQKKPSTMHEALLAVEEDGFIPANMKISPEFKGYKFAYNLDDNQFVILDSKMKVTYPKDANKDAAAHQLWLFADSASDISSTKLYSHYLRPGFAASEIAVEAGVDVGENTGIAKITYTTSGEQEVVIRTAGQLTTLNIKAPNAEVDHYGQANVINVTAVKKGTYSEYGAVAQLNLKQGKVAITRESFVGELSIDENATSQTVEVSNSGHVFSTSVIEYKEESENYQHVPVTEDIPSVVENIVDNVKTIEPTDVISVGTSDSLMNLAWSQSSGVLGDMPLNINITSDIDLSKQTWIPFGHNAAYPFKGNVDGKGHKIIGLSNNGYVGEESYTTSSHTYISAYGFIALAKDDVTVKNLTLDLNIETNDGGVGGVIAMHDVTKFTPNGSTPKTYTCLIENVTVTGSVIAGDKSGAFMSGMYSGIGTAIAQSGNSFVQKVIIRNCVNKASVTGVAGSRVAGFIGASNTGSGSFNLGSYGGSGTMTVDASIEFDNCKNEGNISFDGKKAGGFICQASANGGQSGTHITFKNNCSNSGALNGSKTGSFIAVNNGGAKNVSFNGATSSLADNASL